MDRQLVITSFQLAEETTLKLNAIENNFCTPFMFYTGTVHLGTWPVKWPSTLDSHSFQREF